MNNISKAVTALNNGGIIIFPTDTALGIGCRIDNEDAIKKLFKLRKRPQDQAVPVLVNSVAMAQKYLKPIEEAVKKELIKKYWPGALTIILPCKKEKVPALVRGCGENLGVRMPNHQEILEIISQVGVPILAPSANFSGEKTPYKLKDLDNELLKLVDYVLPGNSKKQQQSTVIDCSLLPWKILRSGAVIIKSAKKVILGINTANNKEIIITIEIDRIKKVVNVKNQIGSQVVLKTIDQLLKENNLSVFNISEIRVNTGPGSFTGLRVGVSIANAISYALKIPINGKKMGMLEEPKY